MLGSWRISWFVLAALLAAAMPCSAADKYTAASVDDSGRLHIQTSDGRSIFLGKQRDQERFDSIAISADGRAVGWVNLYPNCCTSYPIPLKVVILVNGRQRVFTGVGLAVWRWTFSDDGK